MIDDLEIRRSSRAKHPHIKVTHFGRVIVVVPQRLKRFDVDSIIKRHSDWIIDRLNHAQSLRELPANEDCLNPEFIELQLESCRLAVAYEYNAINKAFKEKDRSILITVTRDNETQGELIRWLQFRAKKKLSLLLAEMSDHTGLEYNKLTVRGQKTRWGSCSARRNINLNRNLLFLPEYLVRYLMIHELCHTKHLNHSKDYWGLVASYEPNFRKLEKELGLAFKYIPKWAAN